ncbi:hypothetical protein DPMN_189973 [Dreissena polymorpha]|uniref:Uncharacterized protein n=1 Tax=Dreissena polymorpha TaxID=45954 RepID=A0A9D4DSX9_DREPO|nr:hypothetical protein DPMN_189973 [Dreissena polymorpha]
MHLESHLIEQDPQTFNVTEFGWKKELVGKVLSPVLISDDNPLAPASVLKLVSNGCSSDQSCGTERCGCYWAQLPCTMFCSCYQTCNCAKQINKGGRKQ